MTGAPKGSRFRRRGGRARLLGASELWRRPRLEPRETSPAAQSSAEHDGHFAAPSRQPARTDQDRCPQARRALSVVDQDMARREGRVGTLIETDFHYQSRLCPRRVPEPPTASTPGALRPWRACRARSRRAAGSAGSAISSGAVTAPEAICKERAGRREAVGDAMQDHHSRSSGAQSRSDRLD